MAQDNDIKFMQRCLDLAYKAEGMTYPNPLVGAVIVHNDTIIGEGYHVKAGEPHAEVNAINSVDKKELLRSSVLYVNLEPCSHFGKTPPCTDIILSNKINRVVIGTADTSDKVSGNGIKTLRETGCEVVTDVLKKESRWINRRFFIFNEKKRPYVILKWAQSADGYIDYERNKDAGRKPVWITGNSERVLVHKWRASEQSIMAGAGTIRSDDPQLNVRYWKGTDPVRVILSRSGMLEKDSAVFRIDGINVVFTKNTKIDFNNAEKVVLNNNTSSAVQVTEYLYGKGIQSVLVEGGAEVLNHFISEGVWDEARIFTGITPFRKGIKAPAINGTIIADYSFNISQLKVIVSVNS